MKPRLSLDVLGKGRWPRKPLFGLGLVWALAGCASTPVPTEQLAVSTAAVTNASSAGATELAPGEMRLAQDKLDRARAAVLAKDNLLARTLAEQSELDAQLAITRSSAVKAQRAAGALQDDARVLREELERKAPLIPGTR